MKTFLASASLNEVQAYFAPQFVKMSPYGDRPED